MTQLHKVLSQPWEVSPFASGNVHMLSVNSRYMEAHVTLESLNMELRLSHAQ